MCLNCRLWEGKFYRFEKLNFLRTIFTVIKKQQNALNFIFTFEQKHDFQFQSFWSKSLKAKNITGPAFCTEQKVNNTSEK